MTNEPIRSALANDADYAELVTEFVSHIPKRLDSIRESLSNGDSKQLCTLVHQLKGACGSYGFHELTPVAASLEARIRSGETMLSLADDIEVFMNCCMRMTATPDE